MATDDLRDPIPVPDVLGYLSMVPLPGESRAEAVFMLIKLDNGEWCARSVGDQYNRIEFLGQLVAFTHAATVSEANDWLEDEDPGT